MTIELNDSFVNNISPENIKKLEQQHAKLESYATHGYIYNLGAQFFNIIRIIFNVPFGSIKIKDLKNITFIWTKTRITLLIKKEVAVLDKHQTEKVGDKNFQAIAKIIDQTAKQCLNKGKYKDLEATCAKIDIIRKVLEDTSSTSPTQNTQQPDIQRDITHGDPTTSLVTTTTTTVQQALERLKEDVVNAEQNNYQSTAASPPAQTPLVQSVETPKQEPHENIQEIPVPSEYPEKSEAETPKPTLVTVIKKEIDGFKWPGLLKAVFIFSAAYFTISSIMNGGPSTVQPKLVAGLPQDLSSHKVTTIPPGNTVISPPAYTPPTFVVPPATSPFLRLRLLMQNL